VEDVKNHEEKGRKEKTKKTLRRKKGKDTREEW